MRVVERLSNDTAYSSFFEVRPAIDTAIVLTLPLSETTTAVELFALGALLGVVDDVRAD